MTVSVEQSQEQSEHFAEIVAILSQRIRRCGSCLIASDSLRKIVKTRFGVSGQKSRIIRDKIVKRLVAEGLLLVWSETERNRTPNHIFRIDVEAWKNRFGIN